ncbi:MAG: DUF4837 family protein [Alistipes sp.]|jgi:hypothetical protein|nr:DUF4837 family protein [Alistipes sp.]
MARFSIFGVLAAVVLLAAGCGTGEAFKNTAQGAPYEIVVVADHDVWDSPAGDSIRTIFSLQVPMVNRQETFFDVLRVLPSGFDRLVTRHRNIMITAIDPTASRSSLTVNRDIYARPQIVLSATAPDAQSLAELISFNRENIELALESAEKDRDVEAAMGHTPPEIAAAITEKFGFEMSTGPGYTVRSESEDFLWLSYETPASSQGIVIYSYPFSGVKDFETEPLLARRNEFVARIPGENPGSHMTSNPEFTSLLYKMIGGRAWSELHGFWDVEGDFMGGPYTSFSTLDAARQRVVAIDFYVYSPDPRFSQRNLIRQLEHFIYTVKIDGSSPEWNGDAASSEGGAQPAEAAEAETPEAEMPAEE